MRVSDKALYRDYRRTFEKSRRQPKFERNGQMIGTGVYNEGTCMADGHLEGTWCVVESRPSRVPDVAGGSADRTAAPELGLAVSSDVKHGPSVPYLFIDQREESLSAGRGARECSWQLCCGRPNLKQPGCPSAGE